VAGHRLEDVIPDLVRRSEVVEGSAYIQVTRGCAPRDFEMPKAVKPTVLAYARSKPGLSREKILAGEVLHPVDDRRWAYCNIKAIDLLAAVLAKDDARSAGAHEALFVGADGTVREGGSANILAFVGGTLRTHPADNHILNGITRQHVLELARSAGHEVEERAFTLQEITSGADPGCEVFAASTLKDLMPIVRVGDHVVGDGMPGRLTLALLDRFRRLQCDLVGLEPPAAFS
jgi:D-alanine transaminase